MYEITASDIIALSANDFVMKGYTFTNGNITIEFSPISDWLVYDITKTPRQARVFTDLMNAILYARIISKGFEV
jgi:hypothetical protein